MSRHHEYKCYPTYFHAVWLGRKLFEVRRSRTDEGDDDPEGGDTVMLREWDRETRQYTGRQIQVHVTYVMRGGRFGLADDHLIFGFTKGVQGE